MLDTLSNVKTYLGISGSGDDAALNMILAEADSIVKNYCGYNIEQTEITNEYHSTDGETHTFVVDYPIISSADDFVATYDGSVISSNTYDIIYESGVVVFDTCPTQSVKELAFTYTGGYATIPADLLRCFRGIFNDLNKQRKMRSDVASERIGDYAVTFKDNSEIASAYSATLDKYKRYAF